MAQYTQSATYTRDFIMVLSSDHVSPATGKTVTVNLSKSGAAFAAAGGAITEVGNGHYKIALTTTDTNTLGDLAFNCTATGCDNTDFVDQVTGPDPLNATSFGLSRIDATISSRSTYAGGDTAGTTMLLGRIPGTVQPQTGDSYARLGAPAGASVSADIAEIEAETDNIGNDTPGTTTLLTRVPGTVQPQTGDAYARIGAAGAGLTALGDARIANLDAAVSSRSTYSGGAVASVTNPVQVDMTQAVPTTNTAQTHGDALNAARAQGFGKWVLSGLTLTLYAADGVTVVHTFTIDSATAPTQRI